MKNGMFRLVDEKSKLVLLQNVLYALGSLVLIIESCKSKTKYNWLLELIKSSHEFPPSF